MKTNQIVSQDEWLAARKQHLLKEKEFTRLRDQLSAERRNLPWVKVEKSYVFDGANGKETLADLFDGRSQLIVQHFMFGPGWKEGCVGCSFGADHVDAARVHFEHRDVSFVAISRAPLPEIEAFKKRMGWRFKWVSSFGSDFNYDYHVSFTPEAMAKSKVFYNFEMRDAQSEEMSGISVFYKDTNRDLFHTYSTYARGDELLSGAYMYLDLVPKGRDEAGLPYPSAWWRHHDRYQDDTE
jgi:predicted dithiol-disulfide oxidoreductase (DUF899 family)